MARKLPGARSIELPGDLPHPESDCLDGFMHPRMTAHVRGHAAAQSILANMFQRGRMPHAWLLTGPEGIGKATLCYALARFVLAQAQLGDGGVADALAVSPDHPAVGQIKALSHPNLLVLRRQWNHSDKRLASAILVDDVRRLRSFFGLTAGDDNWRVVIVDQADELNINAANALLKSLEEPPARSLFLLVSAAPAKVLATIRSRCRRLALSGLAYDDLSLAVKDACAAADVEPPDSEAMERLGTLSGGSVRRVLELHSGDGLALYKKILDVMEKLPSLNLKEVDALAEQLGPNAREAEFFLFFSLLRELLHRLVRLSANRSAGEVHKCLPEEVEIARRLIMPGTLARWAELWETVGQTYRQAAALNLDRRILIIETFLRLQETASATKHHEICE